MRRRLWVYRVGVMILHRWAVVSNWHRRLTRVAWAVPVDALCALVTRDQQYSLAKVASGSTVAGRTYVSRIECGRWESLPVKPRDRARVRTCGHVAAPDPPGGVSVPSPLRDPDSIWGSGTLWEVWGPGCFG